MNNLFTRVATLIVLAFIVTACVFDTQAGQIDIHGPVGSGHFGTNVVALPNGNFVVTDPGYDAPGVANVGAVYLYDGNTLALISVLTGSSIADSIGNGGITVLSNGNFVVVSTNWSGGGVANVGAVTWGSATTGVAGVVSAGNSLVGSSATDRIGSGGVVALNNGNYIVRSPLRDNGGAVNAGAVTWGNGLTGATGVVSSVNSLVGSATGDQVGLQNITVLTNNNYVVATTNWDNGGTLNSGAATWGSGTAGIVGAITPHNSLVGGTANNWVGTSVTALSNGNYVVSSILWDSAALNVGAATWGSGLSGVTGVVSAVNSLIGVTANDNVGLNVLTLKNGNYVVGSPSFDRTGAANSGAATWGNGAGGTTGLVTTANSLVGGTANDHVGTNIVSLQNGNYVVFSPNWDAPGAVNAGAVTWGNGASGTTGAVAATNSMVGRVATDQVGSGGVVALTNGNYVIVSPGCDNSSLNSAGAVTWGNGSGGTTGIVSVLNSLFGGTATDTVGSGGVAALNNGNYVVGSPAWDNGGTANVGAATWCNGLTGRTGLVSTANSLVGSTAGDQVGLKVIALTNENYVVGSPLWTSSRGAATWGSGGAGIAGVVSAANSLVGAVANDDIGANIFTLKNGGFVVVSTNWDNGGVVNAGAAAWGGGTTAVTGVVSPANALVGALANDMIGFGGVVPLDNGNFIVISPLADNGPTVNPGAVTWVNGSIGATGIVSTANSIVGGQLNDQTGNGGVAPQSDNQYVVLNTLWDNGGITNAGSATLGNGTLGTTGLVDSTNSVFGSATGGGFTMVFAYAQPFTKLIVGYPATNRVSVLALQQSGTAPSITADPQNSTNFISSLTMFTATATGTSPLGYRWRFNTLPLNEGGNIFNTTTPQLTVSNISGLDAGGYDVVVTNNFGSVTSQVAMLTVVTQTVQLTGTTHDTNSFSMTFTGTPGAEWWVLRATNILGPWTAIGQVPIAGNGTGLFSDPNPPPGLGFYQTRSTP